jgi:hypothetical protein
MHISGTSRGVTLTQSDARYRLIKPGLVVSLMNLDVGAALNPNIATNTIIPEQWTMCSVLMRSHRIVVPFGSLDTPRPPGEGLKNRRIKLILQADAEGQRNRTGKG